MWRVWSEPLSRAIIKAGATYGAVGERDGTSELNEITGGDGVVLLHERDQVVDGVVDTIVGVEVGLDRREQKHGAVSTASTAKTMYQKRVGQTIVHAYALGPWL